MKKNEIFTFTAPNGVEVTAVVVDCLGTCNFEETVDSKHWGDKYLCYAQNRLFYYTEWTQIDKVIDNNFISACDEDIDWYYAIQYHSHEVKSVGYTQKVICEYCVLPEYDEMLKTEQQQFEEDC